MNAGTSLEPEEYISISTDLLIRAKNQLSRRRSTQTLRLSLAIEELKEIHGILTDPECEG